MKVDLHIYNHFIHTLKQLIFLNRGSTSNKHILTWVGDRQVDRRHRGRWTLCVGREDKLRSNFQLVNSSKFFPIFPLKICSAILVNTINVEFEQFFRNHLDHKISLVFDRVDGKLLKEISSSIAGDELKKNGTCLLHDKITDANIHEKPWNRKDY